MAELPTQAAMTEAINEFKSLVIEARKTDHQKNESEFKKLADASADALEKINAAEAERKGISDYQKKLETQLETLEKQLGRTMTSKTESAWSDARVEFNHQVKMYLKTGNEAVITPEIKKVFLGECFKKTMPWMKEEDLNTIVNKTYQEGVNPLGGFFVLPEYSTTRVGKAYETSPMRQYATVDTTQSNNKTYWIDDNLTGETSQTGELQSMGTASTPEYGKLRIFVHKTTLPQNTSLEELEDASINIEDQIMSKIDQRFTLKTNQLFISGNGVSEARGVLDYGKWGGAAVQIGNDANYQRGALEYIQSGSATGLTYNGLINLQNSLVANTVQSNSSMPNNSQLYDANAVFMMHRTTWAEVLKLTDTQDRPLIQMQNLLETGNLGILLGKPVVFAADIPQISAGVGTSPIIYGDFSGYAIVDKLGLQIIRDIYTQAEDGLINYWAHLRVGGGLINYQSLKVLELAAFTTPPPLMITSLKSQHVQMIEDAKAQAMDEVIKEALAVEKDKMVAEHKKSLLKDKTFMDALQAAKKEAQKLADPVEKAKVAKENVAKSNAKENRKEQ